MLLDFKFAIRSLRRAPALVAVVGLTLGASIAGVTVMYGALAALVFDLPPVFEPDRVARLWPTNSAAGVERGRAAAVEYEEWRRQASSWQALAAFEETLCVLEDTGTRLSTQRVTPDYPDAMGVRPWLGRFETEGPVVVLSHRFHERQFGGDRGVLGRWLTLCDERRQVVGVMPQGFGFPAADTDAWMPLQLAGRPDRSRRSLQVAGRLKLGVSWEQARGEMDLVARRLEGALPASNRGWSVRVIPLREEARRRMALGAVGFLGPPLLVLLVACLNVATLMLARAAARQREIATRLALGASRSRLLRQLLTESVLLALPAGVTGSLLAVWGLAVVRAALASFRPELAERISMEAGTLLLPALALTGITPFLFGLAPALAGFKPDLAQSLRIGGGQRLLSGFGRYQGRDLLVITEVGLAVVLVVTTGLLVRFLSTLQRLDAFLNVPGLSIVTVGLPASPGLPDAKATDLPRRIADAVRGLPAVEAAALWETAGFKTASDLAMEDRPSGCSAPGLRIYRSRVGPQYFEALGMHLRRGADWRRSGAVAGAPEVVVSQNLARACWPNADVVGKRVKWGARGSSEPWQTVIGVADDVMLDPEPPPVAQVWEPFVAAPERNPTLLVRTARNAVFDPPSLNRALRQVDARLQHAEVQRYQDRTRQRLAGQWFTMRLLGLFGLLALGLGTMGVYGVLSHAVAQRTREIGIRMALGATQGAILRLVAGRGLALVIIGLVAGSAATAAVVSTTWREVLRVGGVAPFLWASVLLGGAGLLACWVPARRAAQVDPMVAIREE